MDSGARCYDARILDYKCIFYNQFDTFYRFFSIINCGSGTQYNLSDIWVDVSESETRFHSQYRIILVMPQISNIPSSYSSAMAVDNNASGARLSTR